MDLARGVDHAGQRLEVGAGAEVLALAANEDDADPRVGLERAQPGEQLFRRLPVEGVALVGAGDRQAADRVAPLDPDPRRVAHFAPGSFSSRASASGTSMTIRSIAVEKTFPC